MLFIAIKKCRKVTYATKKNPLKFGDCLHFWVIFIFEVVFIFGVVHIFKVFFILGSSSFFGLSSSLELSSFSGLSPFFGLYSLFRSECGKVQLSFPLFVLFSCCSTYEYKRQEPAPRRGLAPPVLIFQTSPSCNFFTKIPRLWRNWCQPSLKGLILGPILV